MYSHKKTQYFEKKEETSDSDTEDEPSELGSIQFELDKNGKSVENNQVLDYFYRDEKLGNLNFYNFAGRGKGRAHVELLAWETGSKFDTCFFRASGAIVGVYVVCRQSRAEK